MSNGWWVGNSPNNGADPVAQLPNPSPSNSTSSNNNNNEDGGGVLETDGVRSSSGRRPRGRPPGSKNRPKAPVIITRESPSALRSHLLEVSAGADIMDALASFARRRRRGVCVLSGSGAVSGVSLLQPHGEVLPLSGRFDILSLSGSFLPSPSPPAASGLTAFLAGSNGQVFGGCIAGELITSGPVMIIAATFTNATFERLPLEERPPEDRAPAPSAPSEGLALQQSPPETGTDTSGEQQLGGEGVSSPLPGPVSPAFALHSNHNMLNGLDIFGDWTVGSPASVLPASY